MDLRRSNNRSCRGWMEGVLLSLERAGVLEATYERNPPHFHVALFPDQYARYAERKLAAGGETSDLAYRVQRGDSLWSIAHRHGVDVAVLRAANDLTGSQIYAGQLLTVPLGK
jgi:nucleoid-associated protein YgaU